MANPTATRDIFVQANGLRHHLLARGSPGGPVVMMIHGLTQQAHVFDGVASRLARRHHVYCLDVRGRGETEWGPASSYGYDTYVEDLEAVREGLGLERFALVGTSMGGQISMFYAARFPERVTAVVLNDVGPEIDPAGAARVAKMAGAAPEAFTDLRAVMKYYREENAPVLGKRSDDEVLEYARWHVRKSDTGVYLWKMDRGVRAFKGGPPSTQPWDAWRAVKCPALVIHGAASDILNEDIAKRMCEAVPGCRVVDVPGVGHAPSLLEPEALTALEAFLPG